MFCRNPSKPIRRSNHATKDSLKNANTMESLLEKKGGFIELQSLEKTKKFQSSEEKQAQTRRVSSSAVKVNKFWDDNAKFFYNNN